MTEMNEDVGDYYDDSDNIYYSENIKFESMTDSQDQRLPYTEHDVKNIFEALLFNLIFDAGFHAIGFQVNGEKNCYCPCSSKMIKWRKQFSVDGVIDVKVTCDRNKKRGNRMGPNSLMAHLCSVKHIFTWV